MTPRPAIGLYAQGVPILYYLYRRSFLPLPRVLGPSFLAHILPKECLGALLETSQNLAFVAHGRFSEAPLGKKDSFALTIRYINTLGILLLFY